MLTVKVGTYSELMQQNGAFAEYLRTHGNEKQDQAEQEGLYRTEGHPAADAFLISSLVI